MVDALASLAKHSMAQAHHRSQWCSEESVQQIPPRRMAQPWDAVAGVGKGWACALMPPEGNTVKAYISDFQEGYCGSVDLSSAEREVKAYGVVPQQGLLKMLQDAAEERNIVISEEKVALALCIGQEVWHIPLATAETCSSEASMVVGRALIAKYGGKPAPEPVSSQAHSDAAQGEATVTGQKRKKGLGKKRK